MATNTHTGVPQPADIRATIVYDTKGHTETYGKTYRHYKIVVHLNNVGHDLPVHMRSASGYAWTEEGAKKKAKRLAHRLREYKRKHTMYVPA